MVIKEGFLIGQDRESEKYITTVYYNLLQA